MAREEITLVGVGDIFVDRAQPETIFNLSKDLLSKADIAFGQLETPYSDKGAPAFHVHSRVYGHDVRNYPAIPNAGFDVISLASNLTYSWGPEAMLDCAERLRRDGIAPVGAGRDVAEARQPAFLERKGTRVAFLAYCSVAPSEDYAGPGKPGVAPMRAFAHYETLDDHTPGAPPQILSAPYLDDLDALVNDVEKAKSQADLVAISIHWGVPHQRATIAQYQRTVAHAAINAGADLILGHHAHILKGIEVYKGKVIFYSLCNWAIDSTPPVKLPREAAVTAPRRAPIRQMYNIQLDPEYPTYRFATDARKTIAAKCIIADRRIQRVSFIPAMVNKQSQAEPLSPSDPRGEDVIQYMQAITEEANLNARFTVERDEVVIT